MPWSLKARELIDQQYAPAGAAARAALPGIVDALSAANARGLPVHELLTRARERDQATRSYVEAYRRYVQVVESPSDIRAAPFHLLATEHGVHADKDHKWHMETLGRLCGFDESILKSTPSRIVDLADEESVRAATEWWKELTGAGGEGMVIKPMDFVSRDGRGLLQPALKCRGREYLRIIYGPEYSLPSNLERLRLRSLGAKRSLALREFALGIEALDRFVNRQGLWRVHECVFGVLALESEPVDPRL